MDENLLYALYSFPIQEQHVRITLLNWEDTPIKSKEGQIQTLQGITTGGSINLNGDSSVRRTASLTLVAFDDNVNITNVDNSISMNKRIKLEIGLTNPYFGVANEDDIWYEINDQDIIWFKMGIFIITNASVTRSANSWQISVNLKDKMVLLNGEVAGTLTEPITHSPVYNEHIDEQGHAVLETSEVAFITLISTLVSTFGRINGNIIIKDIPFKIENIVRWINKDRDIQINPTTHNITYPKSGGIANNQSTADGEHSDNLQSSSIYTFNDTIGYRYIDYVYPAGQNLISNPGETVASVLEKIKNTLGGNYEYFFDVDGNFHFQEIQNRKNLGSAAINNIQEAISEKFWNNNNDSDPVPIPVFTFDEGNGLIVSYQNNPQYSKIKNDISVTGKRDNTVIRYHLVLKNPTIPSNDYGSYSLQSYIRQLDLDGEQLETGIDGQPVTRLQNGNGESITITSSTDYRQYLYVMSIVKGDAFSPWSKEILEEWPKIYDVVKGSFKATGSNLGSINWSVDFVDPSSDGNIFPYLVDNIGLRPAAIKNDGVNCVFQTSAPTLQIIPIGTSTTASERNYAISNNRNWIQVPQELLANITWGSASSSAHDAVRTLLFEYISMQESISLTSIPVYHLEPNTIITVQDKKSDINGDYVISTMSIPLAVTGTMTITAKKAISRI